MDRVCSGCKLPKPLTDFYARAYGKGKRGECKQCSKLARATRHQHAKKYNPLQRRSVVLKNKYGITQVDFEKMFAIQGGRCKVCKSTDPGPAGNFAVDHCHDTGKVRGLLCYKCNMGLGSFRDSITILKNAIEYLKETS